MIKAAYAEDICTLTSTLCDFTVVLSRDALDWEIANLALSSREITELALALGDAAFFDDTLIGKFDDHWVSSRSAWRPE